MALVKCKECSNQVSNKAKTCPQCGAPIPKGYGVGTLLVLVVMIFIVFVYLGETPTGSLPTASTLNTAPPAPGPAGSAARDRVLAQFKSADEPTAQDAIWTSDTMFKVGVLDNGSSRSGYADYVCSVLRENGLAAGYHVEIVDIVSIAAGGRWTVLGEKAC